MSPLENRVYPESQFLLGDKHEMHALQVSQCDEVRGWIWRPQDILQELRKEFFREDFYPVWKSKKFAGVRQQSLL